MKQQLRIMITKRGDKNDGIWVSLPISQKSFEKLTRNVDFDEIEITKCVATTTRCLSTLCTAGSRRKISQS